MFPVPKQSRFQVCVTEKSATAMTSYLLRLRGEFHPRPTAWHHLRTMVFAWTPPISTTHAFQISWFCECKKWELSGHVSYYRNSRTKKRGIRLIFPPTEGSLISANLLRTSPGSKKVEGYLAKTQKVIAHTYTARSTSGISCYLAH
jgi:hypothetical protein